VRVVRAAARHVRNEESVLTAGDRSIYSRRRWARRNFVQNWEKVPEGPVFRLDGF
jgi:hypothetical protein